MSSAIVSRSQQVYSGSDVTKILATADFWVDFSDTSCYTLSTVNRVSTVTDKSASPKSISISGAVYFDNVTKGIRLSGSGGEYLVVSGLATPGTSASTSGETVFIVAYQYSAAASAYLGGSTGATGARYIRGDGGTASYGRIGSSGITQVFSAGLNKLYTISAVLNNGVATQYVNGGFCGSAAYTMTVSEANQQIGRGVNTGGSVIYPHRGGIYEIIIFQTALNDSQRIAVDNYLLNKWTRQTTTLTTPLSVFGCTLWLDGNDATTITYSSGTSVQQWSDKSGNGYHAIQNTASKQPTYDSTLKGVLFNSTNLTGLVTTAPFSRTETVFAVVNMNPTTLGDILGTTASTRGREFMCAGGAGTGSGAVRVYNDNAATLLGQAAGTNFTTTDKYVITFANAAATNRCETNINGLNDQIRTTALNYTTGSFTNVVGATLSTASVRNFNSYIYEIIVFNIELTNQDIVDITNYLMNKWGITRFPTPNIRFPFYKAPFVRLFNPIDIPTCSLWLDAADNTTLTSNISGYVTQWRDKSGNSYHATGFGNTALQTLGKYRGIVFDNATTYFYASNATAMNNTSNLSVIALGTFATPPTANVNWLRMVSFGDPDFNANSNIVALLRYSSLNQLTIERTGTPGSGTDISLNTPFIASSINTTTAINLFVNGTAGYSTSFATKGVFNYSLYNIGRYSGSGVGTPGNFVWSGSIGEVIAYNRYLNKYERELLEGYLAHKWGLINNLPSTHTYKAIVPTTTIFNPLNVRGECDFWLDAYDPNGNGILPSAGTSVTSWVDKSGNGNNVTQASSSLAPVFQYDGVYPGLLFDGSTQYMTGPSGKVTPTTFSVFIVMRRVGPALSPTGTPTAFQVVKTIGTTIRSFEIVSDYGNATKDFYVYSITSQGAGTGKFASRTGSTTRIVISTVENAVNSTAVFAWANGNDMTISSISGGTYATGDPYGIVVGANRFYLASPSYYAFHNGYINELLVYSTPLSIADRQQIEGYLAWKWGTQGSLPSSHPFAKFPPY